MAPWQVSTALNTARAVLPFQRELSLIKRTLVPAKMGVNHQWTLNGALEQVAALKAADFPVTGRRVLEIGSGWYPIAPLIYRLAGAEVVHMTDAHRLLDRRNVLAAIEFLTERSDLIEAALGLAAGCVAERLRHPAGLAFEELLARLGLSYAAPFDLETGPVVDLVFSHTVLEHIPPPALFALLGQIRSRLAPGGLMCHGVDHSDHRAPLDPRLSDIDFLRYSDAVWKLLCIHPQDYTNRLRRSDYLALLQRAGYVLMSDTSYVSAKARQSLPTLPLRGRFRGMDPQDLCTTWSLWVARPAEPAAHAGDIQGDAEGRRPAEALRGVEGTPS